MPCDAGVTRDSRRLRDRAGRAGRQASRGREVHFEAGGAGRHRPGKGWRERVAGEAR